MGVKYEDVPCHSYTYRGRSRSMRCVITAADLASVDRTLLIANGSCPLVPGREVVSRNRNEGSVTGREPFAIDRERFGNVLCGQGLISPILQISTSTMVGVNTNLFPEI